MIRFCPKCSERLSTYVRVDSDDREYGRWVQCDYCGWSERDPQPCEVRRED
jgi:RNase P subunit RPR2